jgi:hypothetical protein
MKTDLYTKTVLTVIASCLVWISVKEIAWPQPVAAQIPPPASVVTVSGFTPNALQQLSAYNPDGRGEARGIPVIVMNELKLKSEARGPQPQLRCVWTHILDMGEPNIGSDGNIDFSKASNWQQMSNAGWELKAVSENNYVFEKCEPR